MGTFFLYFKNWLRYRLRSFLVIPIETVGSHSRVLESILVARQEIATHEAALYVNECMSPHFFML